MNNLTETSKRVLPTEFAVGQVFYTDKMSGGRGARNIEIITLLRDQEGKRHARVKIGNKTVISRIDGMYLLHPMNMRSYNNTHMSDLIQD